jgi:hypothetical protein
MKEGHLPAIGRDLGAGDDFGVEDVGKSEGTHAAPVKNEE